MCIAFAVKEMGSNLFRMSIKVANITGAPLLALFSMGIFLPFVNAPVCIALCNNWPSLQFLTSFSIHYFFIDYVFDTKPSNVCICISFQGIICSYVVSFSMILWISYKSIAIRNRREPLQLGIDGCDLPPLTANLTSAMSPAMENDPIIYNLYRMSYLHYTLFTLLVALIVGTVISLITSQFIFHILTLNNSLFTSMKTLKLSI